MLTAVISGWETTGAVYFLLYNKHVLTLVKKEFKLLFRITFNKYHPILFIETNNKYFLFLFQMDRAPILISDFYFPLTKNIILPQKHSRKAF